MKKIVRVLAAVAGVALIVAVSVPAGDRVRSLLSEYVKTFGMLWPKTLILAVFGGVYVLAIILFFCAAGVAIRRLLIIFALGSGMMLLLPVSAALGQFLWHATDVSFGILGLWLALVYAGLLLVNARGPIAFREVTRRMLVRE
jgi:hypothetical protein